MWETIKFMPFAIATGFAAAMMWGIHRVLTNIWVELAKQTKLKEREVDFMLRVHKYEKKD